MYRLTTLRALAAAAALGALTLAGCGGGSSKSMLPLPADGATAPSSNSPTMTTQNGKTVQAAYLSVSLPTHTSTQSTQRTAILSSSRKPAYIDTTTENSTIVVSTTPQNAAEASQYGNLTICYNLYTNGTLAAANPPNFMYTNTGNNVTSVTVAIPAPPGTDGFQITQYAGQCGSTPYTVPTPPPTNVGASNILAQTPVTYADIEAGQLNQLNVQIANCPLGSATVACPVGIGPGPGAPLTASIAIANIQFGALPIASPVREQGAFLLATGKVGVPIPLEAINAAGTVVPGLTTMGDLTGGAGPFPAGVTVTSNDTTTHTALYLVDATTGGIAQAAASNAAGLSIHEFNVLSNAAQTGGLDITYPGSTAVAGDPWVIVMTTDGSDASITSSVTVTASAIIPPATTATTITTTIAPQSAVYSAGGTGYTDTAVPTAPVGLIQTATGVYFTDGNTVKLDGSATVSPASGTTLGALTLAQFPSPATPTTSFIYAVDYGQVGNGSVSTESNSGVYAFNPATLAMLPVAAQAGSGNWVQFSKPVAVVEGTAYVNSTTSKNYVFVEDSTGAIYKLDIQNGGTPDGNGFQTASNVAPPFLASATLAPGTSTYLGTAMLSGGQMLFANPGNNTITEVDATTQTPTISTYASCTACTGLFLTGTALYATSTSGEIYYISAKGATPVSMGFVTGTAKDGPIGQFASLTPATTPALTPANYPLQFQSGSFFAQSAFAGVAPYAALAAPYTVLPFAGTQVFAAAPQAAIGLKADTSAGGTTGAGVIKATGGIVVVPAGTTATATLTPDSILFVDSAGTGGKLRTIVR